MAKEFLVPNDQECPFCKSSSIATTGDFSDFLEDEYTLSIHYECKDCGRVWYFDYYHKFKGVAYASGE